MISQVRNILNKCDNMVRPEPEVAYFEHIRIKIMLFPKIYKAIKSIRPIVSVVRSSTYNL